MLKNVLAGVRQPACQKPDAVVFARHAGFSQAFGAGCFASPAMTFAGQGFVGAGICRGDLPGGICRGGDLTLPEGGTISMVALRAAHERVLPIRLDAA